MANKQLAFKTEQRLVRELVPYEHNPRQMTEEQVRQLTASLVKFGLAEIPVIDVDNRIVAGHQRLKIMMALGRGDETIDVRVPSRKLTDEEFKEYLIRSNKNLGQWDWNILANVFDEEFLLQVGFSQEEMTGGFGLAMLEGSDVVGNVNVLTVLPPEAPKLKESAQIHCKTKEDYDIVKKYIDENGGEDIIKVILEMAR